MYSTLKVACFAPSLDANAPVPLIRSTTTRCKDLPILNCTGPVWMILPFSFFGFPPFPLTISAAFLDYGPEIMRITMMKSKIHRATVTGAELNYEGSISIDKDLLEKVGILIYEKVQVVNLNNGARFETYVIEAESGSGEIVLNGPAARLGQAGDLIIIIAYAEMTPDEASVFQPKIVMVDPHNMPSCPEDP